MYLVKPGQFYYHFKRDSSKGIEDHAYIIVGLAMHTEDRNNISVIYKPLYYCDPLKNDEEGISFHSRPYHMFIDQVNKPEYKGPRFTLITDPDTIDNLSKTPLYSSLYMDK